MRFCTAGATGVVLSGLLATPLPAQERQGGRFGVQVGITFSKFGGQDAEDARVQYGFAAGGFATLDLGRYVALQPELLYAQKGVRFTGPGGSSSILLGYLEVPLLLKLRLPASRGFSGVSPHVFGGASIGYRVDCRITLASGTSSISQTCGEEDQNPPRRLDGGLVFGAGVDVGRVKASARFSFGLIRLDSSSESNDIKNRAFYLLVGTTFRAPQ